MQVGFVIARVLLRLTRSCTIDILDIKCVFALDVPMFLIQVNLSALDVIDF